MENQKLKESIANLKTATTFQCHENRVADEELAEIIGKINILFKEHLRYVETVIKNEESLVYYNSKMSTKLDLIKLISTL